MKIIALLPVKNEEWILPTFLSSVGVVADEIIAIDNGSTDRSASILRDAGAFVIDLPDSSGKRFPMSFFRQTLLDEGRKRGGTHFICLDADEAFTSPFLETGREKILNLEPGEKILMQWLSLWRGIENYRDDKSVWSNNFKDFIFCDNGEDFEEIFLSEARTPGIRKNTNTLSLEEGAVFHYQFSRWDAFQMKQAWYRCLELIRAPVGAVGINAMYSITLDEEDLNLTPVPSSWIKDVVLPRSIESPKDNFHFFEIKDLFQKYGVGFFEPLEIWHISQLRKEFLDQMGREPHAPLRTVSESGILSTVKRIMPTGIKTLVKIIWKKLK